MTERRYLMWCQALLGSFLVAGSIGSGLGAPGEEPVRPDSQFQGEAFRQLETEVLTRYPELTPDEASQLVQVNFRHVYANCVKASHFIVKPNDEQIASRTVKLLQLQSSLADHLVKARRQLAVLVKPSGEAGSQAQLQLVREVGRVGRKVRDLFRRNFVELSRASFQMTLGQPGESSFLRFLLEAERINRLLADEMERYFLGMRPGVVAVNDYARASVGVLGDALAQLSKVSEEHLKP